MIRFHPLTSTPDNNIPKRDSHPTHDPVPLYNTKNHGEPVFWTRFGRTSGRCWESTVGSPNSAPPTLRYRSLGYVWTNPLNVYSTRIRGSRKTVVTPLCPREEVGPLVPERTVRTSGCKAIQCPTKVIASLRPLPTQPCKIIPPDRLTFTYRLGRLLGVGVMGLPFGSKCVLFPEQVPVKTSEQRFLYLKPLSL